MKKLLVLAIFSSSLLFASKPVVKTVLEDVIAAQPTFVSQPTIQPSDLYVQAVAAVKNIFKNGQEHYLIAGSAAVVAATIALYYTNADFKKAVQAYLGLDVAAVV